MSAFLFDAATLASATVRAQGPKQAAAPKVVFSDTSVSFVRPIQTEEDEMARKKKAGWMVLAPIAALGALTFGFLMLKK